jgi:hypothetical protein
MSDPGVQEGGQMAAGHGRLKKIRRAAADEFRHYLVSFLYIWVLLGMFTMHEEIALRTHGGVPFAPHGFALVNALVLAKVVLVVEDLRIGPRIKPQPLIYPIVIEAFLLAVLFIAMHVLESVASGLAHGRALAASVPAIGGGGFLGLVFAASSFFMAMIPFCAFRHVTTAIGPDRMRALLLGSPAERPSEGG